MKHLSVHFRVYFWHLQSFDIFFLPIRTLLSQKYNISSSLDSITFEKNFTNEATFEVSNPKVLSSIPDQEKMIRFQLSVKHAFY